MFIMPKSKPKPESKGFVEIDSEELGFVLEPTQIEVGSGYTVSVDYDDNEKQIVDVKTYGEADISKIRKEIARAFPNARIRQLNGVRSVTIVKKRKRKPSTRKK